MSVTTTSSQRDQILQRMQAGRIYEFLTLAAAYLDAVPDDDYLCLMAIREYLRLGLVAPARELLATASVGHLDGPDVATVRRSLAALPDGVVPWTRHARRFDDNLQALSRRGVDVTPIREAWADRASAHQLFLDRGGIPQVRQRTSQGKGRWVPRLDDHAAAAQTRALPDDIGQYTPGPYLFEGIELGWYFDRLYRATTNTFLGYSCALFVVEPEPAALAVVFHLHDWRELLSDPRVFWLFGDDCRDRLQELWDSDLDLPFPRRAFSFRERGNEVRPSAVEIVQEAAERRERAVRQSLQELEAQYASRDGSFWARRFNEAVSGHGEPLRILASVSTHTTFLQYSMRDAKRALEDLGHTCRILTEKTPYAIIGPLTFHNAIRELDPDVFFSIDHIRPEFEAILPTNLPLLTWDQDELPHVFTKENIQRIGPLDFVAGWSKRRCIRAGANPKQFLHARVPTSPEQFGGEPPTKQEEARYACDVSYVSHASQTAQAFHEQERAACGDDRLKRLLDAMYEIAPPLLKRFTVVGGYLASSILEEASQRCGLVIRDEELRARLTGWYLWRLGDRMFRHEALGWVAEWAQRTGKRFRIYGNAWEAHPTLSDFAAGPAQNGRELLCIYRASRINLQLMPAGFIHQRALDGLAAGGFFLSRATPTDLRGRTLRQLDQRISELGINTSDALLNSADQVLNRLLHDYMGEWRQRMDARRDDPLNDIRVVAELLHPEEAFPRFRDILFQSAEEFESKADQFLADQGSRRAIAEEMRSVVLQHFTYRPTMKQFLQAMAGYLRDAFA